MKNLLFWLGYVICLLVILFYGFFFSSFRVISDLSEHQRLVYNFIDHHGKILGKKYQLRKYGIGLTGDDNIDVLKISFQKNGFLPDENEARYLVVHLTEDFLKAVNSNEGLRPLLKIYPFTPKNLEIDIFFSDHDDELLWTAGNDNGKVYLRNMLTSGREDYTKINEPFEEAVVKLKESPLSSK